MYKGVEYYMIGGWERAQRSQPYKRKIFTARNIKYTIFHMCAHSARDLMPLDT